MAKEKFYIVKAQGKEIADLLASNPKELIGRTLKVELSQFARGKLGEVSFKITKASTEDAEAEIKRIKLFPSYIQRFIRRGATKIDASLPVKLKEKTARVKPTLLTRKRVRGSVEKTLRIETKNFLEKFCKELTMEELFESIIRGELQRELSQKLKKTYPLSFCEVREVVLLSE